MARKKEKMEEQGRVFIPHMFEDRRRKVQHIIIEVEEEILLTSEEEPEKEDITQSNGKLDVPKRSNKMSTKVVNKAKRERYQQMKDNQSSSSKARLQSEASQSNLGKRFSDKQSN